MAVVKRETDYALRALAALASGEGFMSVSALAEAQQVPALFLRKIMQRLNRAGIVASRQGPFGGYRLAVPAGFVSLLHVLEAVQGPLVMNECFTTPEICDRTDDCPVRKYLQDLQFLLNERLAAVTVDQVAGPAKPKEGARR